MKRGIFLMVLLKTSKTPNRRGIELGRFLSTNYVIKPVANLLEIIPISIKLKEIAKINLLKNNRQRV
jgi:hypothetical protein